MFRPEDPKTCLIFGIALGTVAVLLVYRQGRRGWQQTVGLPLGYMFVFAISHIGSLIYLLPWYDPNESAYLKQALVSIESVSLGTWLAGWSALSFAVGSVLVPSSVKPTPAQKRNQRLKQPEPTRSLPDELPASYSRKDIQIEALTTYLIPNKLVLIGLAFLILGPIIGKIPSVTPIASSAKFFVISGFCLGYYLAVRHRNATFQLYYYSAILILPICTVVLFGFLASGANMFAIAIAFFINRPSNIDNRSTVLSKSIRFFGYMIFAWLALSVFVTYMNARERIRRVVWDDSSLGDKITIVTDELTRLKFFDIYNSEHLQTLDVRLNQSELVGKAIQLHESGYVEFEMGKTLVYATIAWIPRVLWPDKPATGGSDFVTKHTGRIFSTGTTVASGQVFELYANFGAYGPVLGLFLLGLILRTVDIKASQCLVHYNATTFLKWHIVGLVMIQPSTQLFFLVTAVAGAILLVYITSSWIGRPTIL